MEQDGFNLSEWNEELAQRSARLRREEEENERLLMEMLAREEADAQRGVEDVFNCDACHTDQPMTAMFFLEACQHSFCMKCLRNRILEKVEAKKCSLLSCPTCPSPFSQSDIRQILSPSELEDYLRVSVEEVILKAGSQYIRCANKSQCNNVIERLAASSNSASDEPLGPGNVPMSKEAIQHRNEHRFRCRECSTEFCASCNTIPYHLGSTCQQFEHDKTQKHCRYCNTQLNQNNTAPVAPPQLQSGNKFISLLRGNDNAINSNIATAQTITHCCTGQECLERRDTACEKILACGHACPGIRGEVECLPCIVDDCKATPKSLQLGSEYCGICYVESLSDAPCIKLACGHIFHYHCCRQKIANEWSGSRITFGFMDCAFCKKQMAHSALNDVLAKPMAQYNDVKEKSLVRLKIAGGENSDVLKDASNPYYNDPAAYALYRFCFYPCYKCKKPYFGGEKQCEGGGPKEFNAQELICTGCCDSGLGKTNCDRHGTEYIQYKCRYCCNTAMWFCFGTTHFCEPCHQKAGEIAAVARDKLPKCTCNIPHPPNGDEYALGCAQCRALASGESSEDNNSSNAAGGKDELKSSGKRKKLSARAAAKKDSKKKDDKKQVVGQPLAGKRRRKAP